MNTQKYSPIPDTLVVPESQWKEVRDNSVQLHGVKWIHKRTVNDVLRKLKASEQVSQPPKKRRLVAPKPYIWYAEHICHRGGIKRDRIAEGRYKKGGLSGKPRNVKKASKKIACPAKLKATCYKHDPSNVVLTHMGIHNHEIGGVEDIKCLPSKPRKSTTAAAATPTTTNLITTTTITTMTPADTKQLL